MAGGAAADHDAGHAARVPDEEDPGGGDPVCWLDQVCTACGGLSDGPPTAVCERCGHRRP